MTGPCIRRAAAASQNRRAPNRFPSQSPLNPEVLVTQGYAVVYADIAVVGTNDQYVKEIGISAKAAIDECARRGFTDPERVGVGGHSYGASRPRICWRTPTCSRRARRATGPTTAR